MLSEVCSELRKQNMPSMNTHYIVGYLEVRQPKFLMSKLIELEANASTRRPHSHIHTHTHMHKYTPK